MEQVQECNDHVDTHLINETVNSLPVEEREKQKGQSEYDTKKRAQ